MLKIDKEILAPAIKQIRLVKEKILLQEQVNVRVHLIKSVRPLGPYQCIDINTFPHGNSCSLRVCKVTSCFHTCNKITNYQSQIGQNLMVKQGQRTRQNITTELSTKILQIILIKKEMAPRWTRMKRRQYQIWAGQRLPEDHTLPQVSMPYENKFHLWLRSKLIYCKYYSLLAFAIIGRFVPTL